MQIVCLQKQFYSLFAVINSYINIICITKHANKDHGASYKDFKVLRTSSILEFKMAAVRICLIISTCIQTSDYSYNKKTHSVLYNGIIKVHWYFP